MRNTFRAAPDTYASVPSLVITASTAPVGVVQDGYLRGIQTTGLRRHRE